MGLFSKRRSSSIAKDRLKLVLIYDRAGTSSNNQMIEMMKRDILRVISEYIDIDEQEIEVDIKNNQNSEEGVSSALVANIPIKNIKKMGRNKY